MTASLVAVRDWYNSLDEEMQSEIAYFVFSAMPSGPEKDHLLSDKIVPAMKSWLEPETSSLSMTDMGKAICFGAILDAFLGERFTDEGWERARRSNEYLLKHAQANGKLDFDLPRKTLEALPERAARWKVAGEAWGKVEAEWLGRPGVAKYFGF